MTLNLAQIHKVLAGLLFAVAHSVALAASNVVAAQCASSADGRAADMLRKRIEAERIYDRWADRKCLAYQLEQCDKRRVDIAIRERHRDGCPGDPATEPLVDRFRIIKKSGRIQWYDLRNDEYVRFSAIKSRRRVK